MATAHAKINERKVLLYTTRNHSLSGVCHMAAARDKITERKILGYAT